VIGLGLDLDPLLTGEADPADARRSLGFPPDVTIVGIVGRLVPIKNHALFFEAARAVLDEHPDTLFVVAGDGELRARLEADAASELGGHVRFTGWVLSLPRLYAALDVVVLTSLNEGTPFSLIEAAAAGRPVVATDVGGVADAVVDGKTGIIVPSNDPQALARAISRLLADPALTAKMGEAGRQRATTAFSAPVMADRIAGVYHEILAAKHVAR
jgi:glycosyltransferase involved in cell wall biosynthesis